MNRREKSPIEPDWLRVSDVIARFGLGRGTIYRLIQRNQIKSITLGKDSRSTRLIHYASLVEFLEKLWDEQSGSEE